jgi:hypothetical protein
LSLLAKAGGFDGDSRSRRDVTILILVDFVDLLPVKLSSSSVRGY